MCFLTEYKGRQEGFSGRKIDLKDYSLERIKLINGIFLLKKGRGIMPQPFSIYTFSTELIRKNLS